MSTFRGAEVYLQTKTKRRLKLIARAIGTPELTADALADQFLNEVIEARFPAIFDLEEESGTAERKFAQSLKGQWQG